MTVIWDGNWVAIPTMASGCTLKVVVSIWSFPKIGGTPKSSKFSIGMLHEISRPAIGVPPLIWKPPSSSAVLLRAASPGAARCSLTGWFGSCPSNQQGSVEWIPRREKEIDSKWVDMWYMGFLCIYIYTSCGYVGHAWALTTKMDPTWASWLIGYCPAEGYGLSMFDPHWKTDNSESCHVQIPIVFSNMRTLLQMHSFNFHADTRYAMIFKGVCDFKFPLGNQVSRLKFDTVSGVSSVKLNPNTTE